MSKHKISFVGLGTKWWVSWQENSQVDSNISKVKVESKIKSIVSAFDANYSRFKEDSLIGRLNKERQLANPPQELLDMLEYGRVVYEVSNGDFNVGLAAEMERRGYDSRYSFQAKDGTAKRPQLNISMKKKLIKLGDETSIDLGGIGKGWLIDKIVNYLQGVGVEEIVVNAGGDIRADRSEEIEIGLENPLDLSQMIGTITLTRGAIGCSSTNRRRWVNQETGEVLTHLVVSSNTKKTVEKVAVFTYCDSALDADVYATALFVSDNFPKIATKAGVEYLVVFVDGTYVKSPNYPGKLFQ